MKKLILAASIIAVAAIFNVVSAQRATVGIKGGVSFTGLSNLGGDERTAGHGGLFLQTTLQRNWRFQPELIYSAQGQHFRNDLGEKRILALDYIQMPLMFQYYPARRIYLEAGPQVGVLINAKAKDAQTGENKNDLEENYRKPDVGINAGLGVNICRNFGIYGRYTQGLIDVTKSENVTRLNHGVQLGGTLSF